MGSHNPRAGKPNPFVLSEEEVSRVAKPVNGTRPKGQAPEGRRAANPFVLDEEQIASVPQKKSVGGTDSGQESAPTPSNGQSNESLLPTPSATVPGVAPRTSSPGVALENPASLLAQDVDNQFKTPIDYQRYFGEPIPKIANEAAASKLKEAIFNSPKALSGYLRARGDDINNQIKEVQSQKHRPTTGDRFLTPSTKTALRDKNQLLDAETLRLKTEQEKLTQNALDVATDMVVSQVDLANFKPDELGRDLMNIVNPHFADQLKMAEKGGRVIPGIQKAEMERLALNSIKNYINKNPTAPNAQNGMALVESYESDFDERNKELTVSRIREKVGAQLYRESNSGFFGNSTDKLKEVVANPETGLTPSEMKIARESVIPLEEKTIGTNIPGSGFGRSFRNAFEKSINSSNNTIAGIFGVRDDSDRAFDLLNDELASSRFRAPGEGPRGLAQLEQLRELEKTQPLTANQQQLKTELDKYVDIRSNWSRVVDGVGDLTGQVAYMALGAKGLGAVGGAAPGAVGAALGSNTAGLVVNTFINTFDNYKSAAIELMPREDQAAERNAYAITMTGVEMLTERMFPDTKIFNSFMGKVAPSVREISERFANREITQQVAREELSGTMMKYLKPFTKEFGVSTFQNSAEEAAVDLSEGVASSIYGGQDFDLAKTGKQAVNTFVTTALYSPLVAGMAAHGAYRNQTSQNAFFKSAIVDMGKNPGQFLKSIEDLQTSGVITQSEANEKISIVKSAQKYLQELPAARPVAVTESGVTEMVPFDFPETSSYTLHRMNEGILTDRLKATSDPVAKAELQKQIDRSVAIRQGIFDGKIGVTPDIVEVTDDPKLAEELGIAPTMEVPPADLVGTPFTQPAPVTAETSVAEIPDRYKQMFDAFTGKSEKIVSYSSDEYEKLAALQKAGKLNSVEDVYNALNGKPLTNNTSSETSAIDVKAITDDLGKMDLTGKGAGIEGMQGKGPELLNFIQEQATGLTSDRSTVNTPATQNMIDTFGEDAVLKSVAAMSEDDKTFVKEMWESEGIPVPDLFKDIFSAPAQKTEATTTVTPEAAPAIAPEDQISVSEMVGKRGNYKGQPGTFEQDGQTVIFKVDGSNREYELGNAEALANAPISSFGIDQENSVVSSTPEGKINVRGTNFVNNYSDPYQAINRDKNGNVKSVTLDTEDGKKRTFRGQVAQDVAYEITLQEINKNNEQAAVEQFINETPAIAEEIENGRSENVAEVETVSNTEEVSRPKIEQVTEPAAEEIENEDIENVEFVRLPEAIGEFEAVETVPSAFLDLTQYKGKEQKKISTPGFGPVRLIGDPDLIELIDIGAKNYRNLLATTKTPVDKARQTELENKFNTTAAKAFGRAQRIAQKQRLPDAEKTVFIGKQAIDEGVLNEQKKVTYSQFEKQILDEIAATDNNVGNFVIPIGILTTLEKKKAIQDIKKGRNSRVAKEMKKIIRDMYDNRGVIVRYGSGTETTYTEVPLDEWAVANLTTEEIQQAGLIDSDLSDIIVSEGITSTNIDSLKHLFDGFPYSEEDFNAIKATFAKPSVSNEETKGPGKRDADQKTEEAPPAVEAKNPESTGTETSVTPPTKTEAGKAIADKLRKLKIGGNSAQVNILAIPTAIYNGVVSTVAQAFELGGAIADIVQKGVDYAKNNWGSSMGKFNPNEIGKNIRTLIMGVLFAGSPLTVNTNIQSYTPEQRATQDQRVTNENNRVFTIEDNRQVDAASGKPVTDRNKATATATVSYARNIVRQAINEGIEPYTALAMAMQETKFDDDTYMSAFHQIYGMETEVLDDPNYNPFRDAMRFLKNKMDYAKKIGKETEAEQIQAWNGYGKLGPTSEYQSNSYYGIDVTKENLDMNKNPVYGKRVIDLRDNVIKKNADLKKLVDQVVNETETKKRIANINSAGKNLADTVRSLKVPKQNVLQSNILGLPIAVYDAALETIALAIEGGTAVAAAIQRGIAEIKKTNPNFDEAGFTAKINEALGESTPEPNTQTTTSNLPGTESLGNEAGATDQRRFTQRAVTDRTLTPEAIADIAKNLEYLVQANVVSVAKANEIIAEVGVDEAYNIVTGSAPMNGAVRVVMGIELIEKFNTLAINAQDDVTRNHYIDQTVNIADYVGEKLGTSAGQQVQAFALYKRLSPEAQVRKAIKDKKKQTKPQKEKAQPPAKNITDKINKINEETAKEITEKPEVKKQIAEKKTKTVDDAKNKIEKARQKREDLINKRKNDKGKGGALYSSPGLTKEGIEFVGNIAKTYFDEGIAQFTIVVDNVIRDIQALSGKPATVEVISDVNNIVRAQYDKILDKRLATGIKAMEKDIGKIIRDHYTVSAEEKKELVDKLIDETGMSPEDAADLSATIEGEFDRIATRKKQDLLAKEKRRFDKVNDALAGPKKVEKKQLQDEFIKYSNLGALGQADMVDFLAKKLGTGTLSPEQIKDITDLSNAVQNAKPGSPKTRAIEALLKYQADLKGTNWLEIAQAIWYSNVLSGWGTQVKNFISTFANGFLSSAAVAMQNPMNIPALMVGGTKGFGKGFADAYNTILTGESPIHYSRVELPDVLERTRFIGGWLNPYNYLKMVSRVMKASDVLFFQALKEARITQMAYRSAAKSGNINPFSKSTWAEINDKLLNTSDRIEAAEQEAESEGLSGIKKNRRVAELMEQSRPVDMVEEAYGFAAKGTFNHDTQGTLGWLTDAVSVPLGWQPVEGFRPLGFVVPFTRILTNVVNNAIDYSLLGLVRAVRGKRGFAATEDSRFKGKYHKMTDDEKAQTYAKVALGAGLTGALYAMSLMKYGDDDEPLIEITGAGTGDYKKDAQLKESGWQPYSIKINGKYYSYALTPLVFNLGWIGSMNDLTKYKEMGEDEVAKKIALTAWHEVKMMSDMTWIGSTGTMLSAMNSDNPEAMAKNVQGTLSNMGKSFILPNAYTQSAQRVQNWWNMPQKQANDAYERMIQDVPIARDRLNNKVNALGDPIVRDVDIIYSSVTTEPVLKFLLDKKAWVAPVDKKSLLVWDPKLKQDREATDDEYYEYAKNRGGRIKRKLQEIIANGAMVDGTGEVTVLPKEEVSRKPAKDLTTTEVKRIIKSASTSATKQAKKDLLFDEPVIKKSDEPYSAF